ncbi:hypothetical protein [Paraburkholderia rhizosphaerae]|uniref:Uncharacterized protein n=1 Tax=Paraburkholderia rhizosphaerae TaxID=480658 RepID=A0A4R8L9R1_9BURK|nr:hypothetical protein [Paraburkholderia rhizosphaerae]TDY38918.1 hypothetical protein BX592_12934 [Paraburkholderia rhizosphaerae]
MATTRPGTGDDNTPHDPSEESPTETSKPIGDAIPTPVEPGLNQPLPEKEEPPAKHDQRDTDTDTDTDTDSTSPVGESDPPKGVPAPGPSDFALRDDLAGNPACTGAG